MPDLAGVAERVWYESGVGARTVRTLLAPAAAAFGGVVWLRGALYDRGVAPSESLGTPAISVGNLTVGGTGKTPVAAWIASRLRSAGGHPAIVLRGYGDDEPLVHALLNPDVPVVANADRVAGAREAAAHGADVVVLDDAFQHRRVRRDVDLVLVSAEQSARRERLLPAGPYREPLSALRRATAVTVTRKTAPDETVRRVIDRVVAQGGVPRSQIATVTLSLDALRSWSAIGETRESIALSELAGQRVLAVSAIGAPRAFLDQLTSLGARVDAATFADHHAFTPADVDALVTRAAHVDRVVCTLKDAVKLGPQWPRLAPTLWYVSQRLTVEDGQALFDAIVARLLARGAR